MAGPTLRDTPARCNSCGARQVVSLTFEWCARRKLPIMGEDIACELLTASSSRATKSGDEGNVTI